jgi:hypothetical protein
MRKNYSEKDIIEAVASSTSIAQVLTKLSLAPKGGNYRTIKTRIKELSLNTAHFLGQGHLRGKRVGPKRPITAYLNNEHLINSHKLRKRLIQEKYFEEKCYGCNRRTWRQKPIALELEHIDGDHQNNKIDNLTLLCPNCHSQTSTYRRPKNK